jgi:two-component system phosphate regulon sensor histidine kinase PhoR
MQKKILLTYIALIVTTMIFSVGLSWSRINTYIFNRVETETLVISGMLHKAIEDTDQSKENYQNLINDYADIASVRITLIDIEGNVIADSDNDAIDMDNHGNRPEVKAAINGVTSTHMRYSNTMQMYFFYYALPITNGEFQGVLRVSVPVDEIKDISTEMIVIFIIGAFVGTLVAVGVAHVVTNRIMKPINELTRVAKVISEGDYDEKIYISQKDQIGELATAFNTMTFNLKMNMWHLSQKNAELESILTSMSSGLAAINMDYKIVLSNDNFSKLLNLPEVDLQDRLFYEVIRELSVFEIIEKAVEEKTYLTDETIINYDGEERMIQISAAPIFTKERKNKALGTLLLITDITQIRKLENMRRDFVSNVTHELKTPLTSIRGFVDTLKNGAINDEAVALRFLDIIDIETDRLSNLIQDILSLSEIESVVGDKNIGAYNIKEIVDEVIDIIPKDKEEVKIIVEIDPEVPAFNCNRDRIKQLLINLIDNSMKYTDEGYIKIRCYESHNFLHIVIEDTGIGIKYQYLSRIFERFYRVDKGRSRKMGGTGLGLSIVKHIVELYSGEIKIDSEEGVGTTVQIQLPY